eukprot:m51a1_g2762 putative adenylate guanylate cyclase (482) ;mRNA; r:984666-986426
MAEVHTVRITADESSSSAGSSLHDPVIVRALRMRRWLGCLWRTSRYKAPFSLVLVLLVSVAIVIPVVASDCLLSWSSNSLIRERVRSEVLSTSTAMAQTISERLQVTECAARNLGDLLSANQTDYRDGRAVRLAAAQLLNAFGTRVCDSYFTRGAQIWGVVRDPDGHFATWTTNSSNITCQTVLDDLHLLHETSTVDWCMDLQSEKGIWYTVTNHSVDGDESWTSVYSSDVTLYVSFSYNVFDKSGDFIGITSSDWIVPSIKLLLDGIEQKDGVGFLVEPSKGLFLVFDMSGGLIVGIKKLERSGLVWLAVAASRPNIITVSWLVVGVSIGVTLLILAITSVVSWVTTRPLHNIASDMTSICDLKFGHLRTRASRLSSIAEMRRMQECFIQLKAGTHALSKFVPPQVVLSIMQSRSGQVERYMKTKYISIMFTDLKGFTTLSEAIPLQKLMDILNMWFEEFGSVIESNGGVIDKFIGDVRH